MVMPMEKSWNMKNWQKFGKKAKVVISHKKNNKSKINNTVRNMRVSKLPPIRPSRYGPENRKCWSQIALAGIGEKRFYDPSL